jgi:hypothetical protein
VIVRRRVPLGALVLTIVLSLAAAACSSGGGERAAPKETAPPPSSTTTTEPPVFPLTGLPAPDAAVKARPALVVKIENVDVARPQAGLLEADVVYEEVVEGGQSRLAAVFHSRDADPLGPIRSVRPSDPIIMKPLVPLFAYSGGTQKFKNQVAAAGMKDIGLETACCARGYYRRPGRSMPHNVYSSTQRLYSLAPPGMAPPPKMFDFLPAGQPFGGAGAAPATLFSSVMGLRTRTAYQYDPATATWKRVSNGTPQVVESGAQVAPTNVIVWFVPYVVSPGDVDPVGEPVQVVQAVGTGEAWVLSQGQVVKGRWIKPSAEAQVQFVDAAGAPIRITPGTTWIELQPTGTPATVQ